MTNELRLQIIEGRLNTYIAHYTETIKSYKANIERFKKEGRVDLASVYSELLEQNEKSLEIVTAIKAD